MSATPLRDPKSGTWWFVVDLPAGGDGGRRQAKRRGFRTKTDAQAALDELRAGVRKGTYIAPVRQTLGQFLLDDWLPAIRTTIDSRYLRLHVIPAGSASSSSTPASSTASTPTYSRTTRTSMHAEARVTDHAPLGDSDSARGRAVSHRTKKIGDRSVTFAAGSS